MIFCSLNKSGSGLGNVEARMGTVESRLGNVEPSSAVVSVSDSFPTFSPADMDMNMDSRSTGGMEMDDHMVGSMDDNNSNISGPTSNISPRGQDVGYVNNMEGRTTFSVDVPPFKSNLDKVSFSQSDMGQVFSAGGDNDQVYSGTQDMDIVFSTGAESGHTYSQVFSATDGSNDDYGQVFSSNTDTNHTNYNQGFSSGHDTGYTPVFSTSTDRGTPYSQPFSSTDPGLSYSNSDVSSGFNPPHINNIMAIKSPSEQTNICKVRLHALSMVQCCMLHLVLL